MSCNPIEREPDGVCEIAGACENWPAHLELCGVGSNPEVNHGISFHLVPGKHLNELIIGYDHVHRAHERFNTEHEIVHPGNGKAMLKSFFQEFIEPTPLDILEYEPP